jgi:hypothetical protein
MTTHVVYHNAVNGDLVDIDYACSLRCMGDRLEDIGIGVDGLPDNGSYTFPDGTSVDFGARPCGDETDYDVHCTSCDALMWRGLQSDHDDESEGD